MYETLLMMQLHEPDNYLCRNIPCSPEVGGYKVDHYLHHRRELSGGNLTSSQPFLFQAPSHVLLVFPLSVYNLLRYNWLQQRN
jgi:hypothetical protein